METHTMREPGIVELIDRFCKEEGPRGQDFVLLSEAETRGYWMDVKSRRTESIYTAGRTFGLEDAKPRVRVEWSEAGEEYIFVVNRDESSYVFKSPLQIADFFRGVHGRQDREGPAHGPQSRRGGSPPLGHSRHRGPAAAPGREMIRWRRCF